MIRSANSAFRATLLLALLASPVEASSELGSGPAVFGSAVLSISRSPYDAQWKRVEQRSGRAAALIAAAARKLEGLERLRFVNRTVNAAVSYRPDADKGNSADRWASSAETLARGAGDCEDFAIAKMDVLRASRIHPSDLFLVIGRDLATRSDHAVLVVRASKTFWVLDNLHQDIRMDAQYSDFRPVISLSSRGAWLHGRSLRRSHAGAVGASRSVSSLPNDSLGAVLSVQNTGSRS